MPKKVKQGVKKGGFSEDDKKIMICFSEKYLK